MLHQEQKKTTIFEEKHFLKDQLSSLLYRMEEIESNINKKIDRNECLNILDHKADKSHIQTLFQQFQLQNKIIQKQQQERTNQMQAESVKKISQLSKKLKLMRSSQNKSKSLIKPQQLYLQSNQTMFSMIIEQINSLKEQNKVLTEVLQSKNKKAITLNNEVCRKIQRLQQQLNSKVHTNPPRWVSKTQPQAFESLRIQLLSKSVQSVQQEMVNKMNIRDVIPLIKQQLCSYEESISTMKEYLDESIESTKKILTHQSDINVSLCSAMRMGMWLSNHRRDQFCIWSKEVVNLLPEAYEWTENHSAIRIAMQGYYLLQFYSTTDKLSWKVIVNMEVCTIKTSTVLKLQKGCDIRVADKEEQQLYFTLLKLS